MSELARLDFYRAIALYLLSPHATTEGAKQQFQNALVAADSGAALLDVITTLGALSSHTRVRKAVELLAAARPGSAEWQFLYVFVAQAAASSRYRLMAPDHELADTLRSDVMDAEATLARFSAAACI